MKTEKKTKCMHIHMIGIGGIGISALAQLYLSKGHIVTGSDRNESIITKMLKEKGILVFCGEQKAENISPDVSFVVYSAAVHKDNPEYREAIQRKIPTLHYFEALGEATCTGTNIVISGTHGKTTTTAMIADILIRFKQKPTVVAGSILTKYHSNFIKGRSSLCVIEGCEYERHFLHLSPTFLVITNIEKDHTDYFKDENDIFSAFREMISRLKKGGALITTREVYEKLGIRSLCKEKETKIIFYEDQNIPNLLVKGNFNEENARAAKCVVKAFDSSLLEKEIDSALSLFQGTWRRFEYKGKNKNGALVYDDYAHHPTAVKKTLTMVREEFPNKKIVVIFHPHLYSRTRDFFDGFASALALADEAYILPVFAAREAYDPSVRSEVLAEVVTKGGGRGYFVPDFVKATELLRMQKENALCITMGAGDVYRITEDLEK
jgi:UDP-N-acetylmuramate--alanine ligase